MKVPPVEGSWNWIMELPTVGSRLIRVSLCWHRDDTGAFESITRHPYHLTEMSGTAHVVRDDLNV